jgi:hypothetical protein
MMGKSSGLVAREGWWGQVGAWAIKVRGGRGGDDDQSCETNVSEKASARDDFLFYGLVVFSLTAK